MKKVGIQGLEGSFSEQAAKFYCNKFDIHDFELAYLISSMNVLKTKILRMRSSRNVSMATKFLELIRPLRLL